MKLLLTSGGLSNKSIVDALLELTGKPFSELNIAFIPTASNVEDGDKGWLIKDLATLTELKFKSIDIVDISALPKDVWLSRIKETDVFLFEGGNTFHLMYSIEKSGLKEVLPDLLKTRVYVGISAGSMVACKGLDLSNSERLYSEEIGKYKKDEGMGFVDFLLRPHLNSPHFPKVIMENMEKISKEVPETFYAIDDNTAIKIDGEKIEVVSEGVWKKFN